MQDDLAAFSLGSHEMASFKITPRNKSEKELANRILYAEQCYWAQIVAVININPHDSDLHTAKYIMKTMDVRIQSFVYATTYLISNKYKSSWAL